MISAHERADLVHILKMKHYVLRVEDADQLLLTSSAGDDTVTSVTINSRDNQPVLEIERAGSVILLEAFKSVDDLKIFLEGDGAGQYFG